MRTLLIFTVGILFATLPGCERVTSTPLLAGIPSRISSTDVKGRLGTSAGSWSVVDRLDTRTSESNQGLVYISARISELQDLGSEGSAQFEFLDDQLVSATFFPKDANRYEAALQQTGVTFERDEYNYLKGHIDPSTEIIFIESNGSFKFQDQPLARTMALRLAGEE